MWRREEDSGPSIPSSPDSMTLTDPAHLLLFAVLTFFILTCEGGGDLVQVPGSEERISCDVDLKEGRGGAGGSSWKVQSDELVPPGLPLHAFQSWRLKHFILKQLGA